MKVRVLVLTAVLLLLIVPYAYAALSYWGSFKPGTSTSPTIADAKLGLAGSIVLVLWDQAKGEGYGFKYVDYSYWDELLGARDTVYMYKVIDNNGVWEAVSTLATQDTDPPCELVFLHYGDFVKVYTVDGGRQKFLADIPGAEYQVYLASEASFLLTSTNPLSSPGNMAGALEDYWWFIALALIVILIVASKR